jgi:hypothetical protein
MLIADARRLFLDINIFYKFVVLLVFIFFPVDSGHCWFLYFFLLTQGTKVV